MSFFHNNEDNAADVLSDEDLQESINNWQWLLAFLGKPARTQATFDAAYFPNTFAAGKSDAQLLLKDLTVLMQLQENRIHMELCEDFYSSGQIPYETEHRGIWTEIQENGYRILVTQQLQKQTPQLLHCLIAECTLIKLISAGFEPEETEDNIVLIHHAACFMGFGMVLAQNLFHAERKVYGDMQEDWYFNSGMPPELMTCSLALFCFLNESLQAPWTNFPDPGIRRIFDDCLGRLQYISPDFRSETELTALKKFREAYMLYRKQHLQEASELLLQSLQLSNNAALRADILNNIGYYSLRGGDYNTALQYFRQLLSEYPEHPFVQDNIGYTLIQLGRPQDAKPYLNEALRLGQNNPAYTHRNLALYYSSTDQAAMAAKHFREAFDLQSEPVDLLELHYAEFLHKNGDIEKARTYLQMAIDKQEPEALNSPLRKLLQ